jgi:hypothetical protein
VVTNPSLLRTLAFHAMFDRPAMQSLNHLTKPRHFDDDDNVGRSWSTQGGRLH